MLKPHRILALTLLVAGCDRMPSAGESTKAPPSYKTCGARAGTAATPEEAISLADTKAKESNICSRAHVRCDYNISSNLSEISVRVNFIFIDSYGDCIQAGDGYRDYIYNKQGKFLRSSDIGS